MVTFFMKENNIFSLFFLVFTFFSNYNENLWISFWVLERMELLWEKYTAKVGSKSPEHLGKAVSKAQSSLLAWKINSMSSAELWGPSRSGFTYLLSLNSKHVLSMHQCFAQKRFQVSAWNTLCSTFNRYSVKACGWMYKLSQLHDLQVANMVDG